MQAVSERPEVPERATPLCRDGLPEDACGHELPEQDGGIQGVTSFRTVVNAMPMMPLLRFQLMPGCRRGSSLLRRPGHLSPALMHDARKVCLLMFLRTQMPPQKGITVFSNGKQMNFH